MTKRDRYNLLNFVKFIKSELKITLPFKLKLSSDRQGFKTYAYYDPVNKIVSVYVKNRALADIMRSVAHEFVHHMQNQNNEIAPGEKVQDVGGKIEDDANSIAGQLIKKFGYANPTLDLWNTEVT